MKNQILTSIMISVFLIGIVEAHATYPTNETILQHPFYDQNWGTFQLLSPNQFNHWIHINQTMYVVGDKLSWGQDSDCIDEGSLIIVDYVQGNSSNTWTLDKLSVHYPSKNAFVYTQEQMFPTGYVMKIQSGDVLLFSTYMLNYGTPKTNSTGSNPNGQCLGGGESWIYYHN